MNFDCVRKFCSSTGYSYATEGANFARARRLVLYLSQFAVFLHVHELYSYSEGMVQWTERFLSFHWTRTELSQNLKRFLIIWDSWHSSHFPLPQWSLNWLQTLTLVFSWRYVAFRILLATWMTSTYTDCKSGVYSEHLVLVEDPFWVGNLIKSNQIKSNHYHYTGGHVLVQHQKLNTKQCSLAWKVWWECSVAL